MSYELMMACLCFTGVGIGIYVIYLLTRDEYRE